VNAKSLSSGTSKATEELVKHWPDDGLTVHNKKHGDGKFTACLKDKDGKIVLTSNHTRPLENAYIQLLGLMAVEARKGNPRWRVTPDCGGG